MSIEIDNLRITKLREYLMEIIGEIKDSLEQVNIDFLSNEPDNYSIDKIPVAPQINQWIIGPVLQREVYSFRSRMNYSADVISNLENIGFYELFARKIKEKNNNNELPEIDGIQQISCLNAGTMARANTNTAEFDIQIEIQFREVEQ